MTALRSGKASMVAVIHAVIFHDVMRSSAHLDLKSSLLFFLESSAANIDLPIFSDDTV